jgi:Fe-S-cluster containining protein
MKVEEINKAGNVWCEHCQIASGCKIYAERPKSCQVYECVWLKTQTLEKPIPLALRPDRSKVVIGTTNAGEEIMLYVTPDRPDAWQQKDFSPLLGEFKRRGVRVSVSCNEVVQRII